MSKVRSDSCIGEKCTMCKKEAFHKVSEVQFEDMPSIGHGLTAYVCQMCFDKIMKPYLFDNEGNYKPR